jgi:hypothetical protein
VRQDSLDVRVGAAHQLRHGANVSTFARRMLARKRLFRDVPRRAFDGDPSFGRGRSTRRVE